MSAPSTPCTPPPGHWPSAATRCSRSRSRRCAGSVSAPGGSARSPPPPSSCSTTSTAAPHDQQAREAVTGNGSLGAADDAGVAGDDEGSGAPAEDLQAPAGCGDGLAGAAGGVQVAAGADVGLDQGEAEVDAEADLLDGGTRGAGGGGGLGVGGDVLGRVDVDVAGGQAEAGGGG